MIEAVVDPAVDHILAEHPRERTMLIPVLQQVQGALGYLPEWAVQRVAEYLHIPVSHVYGIITSYTQFRLTPRGEKLVRVCRGTACHVRGGAGIRKAVEEELGVAPGENTADMKFTYETIACMGACGLAPVMAVESTIYGEMTPARSREVLQAERGNGG